MLYYKCQEEITSKEKIHMTRYYGSLQNRLEENRQWCATIEVGTGMTEYLWSDRKPYEVVEVIDQKHVKVRRYDHKAIGGAYSNDWELISNENNPVMLMTKRGNYWYMTVTVDSSILENMDINTRLFLAHNNIDIETLKTKGKVTRYHRMNVSFGHAEYYYDYEF